MINFIRTLTTGTFLAFGILFTPATAWPGTYLRPLQSGVWHGAVRGNEQGVASSCYLARRTNAFWMLLKFDNQGLHIILYNENWALTPENEYQSRVVIEDTFDGLVTARIPEKTGIDFLLGNDEPTFESLQAGKRITLSTQNGDKSFGLKGTRNAVNVLIDCFDNYLSETTDSPATTMPASPAYAGQWLIYNNARFGTIASIPAHGFSAQPPSDNGDGQTWISDDGLGQILVFGNLVVTADILAGYRQETLGYAHDDGVDIVYNVAKNNWFAYSGFLGPDIIYEKVVVMQGCDPMIANHIYLRYPANQKKHYNPIVKHIASSLEGSLSAAMCD